MAKFTNLYAHIVAEHGGEALIARSTAYDYDTVRFLESEINLSFISPVRDYKLTDRVSELKKKIAEGTFSIDLASNKAELERLEKLLANRKDWDQKAGCEFGWNHPLADGKNLTLIDHIDMGVSKARLLKTDLTICSRKASVKITGPKTEIQTIRDAYVVKFESKFNFMKLFKAMEFVSKLRVSVKNTIESTFGKEAGDKMDTILSEDIKFGGKFDIFKTLQLLNSLNVDMTDIGLAIDGEELAEISFSIDVEKLVKALGADPTEKDWGLVDKSVISTIGLALYQSAFLFQEADAE